NVFRRTRRCSVRYQAIAVLYSKRASVNLGTLDPIGELEGFHAIFYTDRVSSVDIFHVIKRQYSNTFKAMATTARSTPFESCICMTYNAKYLGVNYHGTLMSFAYNSGCGGVEAY
ncbi:uncharacterized protein N7482_008823, partial [Penicillium canariense]